MLGRARFRTVSRVISRRASLGLVAGALGLAAFPRSARAADELRLGTLAPRDSVWGKTLAAWAASVAQETGGQLKISLYFAGSQGDEPELVAKVRDRALDGAALTGTGLSAFSPDVAALELPGIVTGTSRLDRARNAIRARAAEGFDKAGVRLLAEGDTGAMRLFSREAEVVSPRDLAKMQAFVRSGDLVGRGYLENVTPKPPTLATTEVLSALLPRGSSAPPPDGGARAPHVNVVFASSLAVTELKWADLLEYVTPSPVAYGIGGIVVGSGRFDSLAPEARAIVRRTAEATGSLLTQRVRAADDAAYARLRAEKKVVTLTDEARAEWADVCEKLKARMKKLVAHPDVVDAVALAGA